MNPNILLGGLLAAGLVASVAAMAVKGDFSRAPEAPKAQTATAMELEETDRALPAPTPVAAMPANATGAAPGETGSAFAMPATAKSSEPRVLRGGGAFTGASAGRFLSAPD